MNLFVAVPNLVYVIARRKLTPPVVKKLPLSHANLQVCVIPCAMCYTIISICYILSSDQGTLRYSLFHENMLEIYNDNTWSLVCYEDWSEIDSLVACKQLGYSQVEYHTYIYNDYLNTFTGNFSSVNCTGNEQNLGSCDHTEDACLITYTYYSYYYGEYISDDYHPGNVILYCTSGNCTSIKYRLFCRCFKFDFLGDCEVHAPRIDQDYHLVEYFEDEQRYYVCADGFTYDSAIVVCRDTAHSSALDFRNVSELDIPPFTNIFPLRTSCDGTEPTLCECDITGEGCPSGAVVEVRCGKPGM